ncbi:MAG: CoA ester lyase [Chloroflexota bacterium]|nr:CoA ester lyase [Chloroflexota bacterium]
MTELFRSLLFVPGNRERMLERAASAGADAVVIDLEDAVPASEKRAARRMARASLKTFAGAGVPVFVRVNGIGSGVTRDDLMALARKGLAGVVLPKAEHPQDLRDLDVLLREAEMANKVRPGDIAVIPLIESPRALLRCETIALASDRIVALSLGGEDYSAAMGIARDAGGVGLAHARYVGATVAAAHGMASIDTPYADIRDAKGLEAETKLAKAIGFRGKYVLHPGQVASVNRIFSPSRAEVADARRVIAAADDGAATGAGSVSLDGRMVDAPVVQRANDLLALAEAIKGRGQRV